MVQCRSKRPGDKGSSTCEWLSCLEEKNGVSGGEFVSMSVMFRVARPRGQSPPNGYYIRFVTS